MKNLNFKIARIHAGLTQLELAEKSGVSLSRITRIEAGYTKPYVDEVEAFSHVLGVQPSRLLSSPMKKSSITNLVRCRQMQ